MGFLFFDIESFVAPQNEQSGLNPHHPQSKVIVISYNYYSTPKAPSLAQVKEPKFLFEWVLGSEEQLLKEFFLIIKTISKEDKMLKIVGFNQLAYDLPYLFSRMSKHNIASSKEIFDLLFTLPRHIDLSQLSMPVSNKTKNDEDFRCISQKVINSYFDIPIKQDTGKDVSEFYIKKRYDLIERYVKEEFTFEMLYQSLLDYFLYVK